MQQILSFSIDIFDIRRKDVLKIRDDSSLVSRIQIQKDIQLNNQAVIVFAKSKSYEQLEVQKTLKLFNYVKIKLIVKNKGLGEETKEDTFYFSGFITGEGNQNTYGQTPMSNVSITISDFSTLFKTTFYTKNLTFLDILQEAEPSFRLLNFSEVFNDKDNKLLDDFYSINQIGYVFFVFFFFRFLYTIVYEIQGGTATPKRANGEKIFKDFKIFMPFGFDVEKEGSAKQESLFKNQVSSLIIYKHLQGVALDLYKYLYPEPIFEFTTYETQDSVILQIRPTPFMCFDANKQNLSNQEIVESYNVIEEKEFGHKFVSELPVGLGGDYPNSFIERHLYKNDVTKRVFVATEKSKGIHPRDLLPNQNETIELMDRFYKMIPVSVKYLESSSFSRSAQSVVNVIWTTPATDTAVLQTSGRQLVYALLEQRLPLENGKRSQAGFRQYVNDQFVSTKDPNPVFLMNYSDSDFISGDMKYFGFREFEVKWNCLTLYESSAHHILSYIDKAILQKIKDDSEKDTTTCQMLKDALNAEAQRSERKKKQKVNRNVLEAQKIGIFYKEALENTDFKAALKVFGIDPKTFNKDSVVKFIQDMREKGTGNLGSFVAKLNGIIAKSYRENEHLYDGSITKPIDVSILPGMIIDSKYEGHAQYNSPRFRGYVSAVNHVMDFNSATMKTTIMMTRTALENSKVSSNVSAR